MKRSTKIICGVLALLAVVLLDVGAVLLKNMPSTDGRPDAGRAVPADGPADASPAAPHAHAFTETVAREATCTQAGERRFRCEGCGQEYAEPIPSAGHRYRVEEVANENGRPEPHHVCEVCGADADVCPAPLPEEQQEALNGIFRQYGAFSGQAAVIEDGAVTGTFVFGDTERSSVRPVDTDTKYRVASITKLVTFLLFMALQDRGIVDENEDISVYFGYPCRNLRYPEDVITPAMLMTHTAGFATHGITSLSGQELNGRGVYYDIRPGAAYSYSNVGAALVGCLCEKATGRYLDDLAKEYLFVPLGVDAAFLARDLKDTDNLAALYGEDGGLSVSSQLWLNERPLGTDLNIALGNLTISAKDYAKIIAMLLNGGRNSAGETVLSEAAVQAVMSGHIQAEGFGVGYGVELREGVIGDKTFCVHMGSAWGMFSAFAFNAEDRDGAVALTSGCGRYEDAATCIYSVCLDAIRAVYPKNDAVG